MYYSFVMMKPDALRRNLVEKICTYLHRDGLEIELVACRKADSEHIKRHYAQAIEKYGGNFQEKAERYFSGQYVLPMLVKSEDENVVERVRRIVGATDPKKAAAGTIRGDLGIDSFEASGRENRTCENLIHASDSGEAVRRESEIWFSSETCSRYFGKKQETE